MKKLFLVTTILLTLSASLFAQKVIEKIMLEETVTISSKILGQDRNVFVYLPTGYENSKAQFPVLYLLDGTQHFHHGSGIVQFLSSIAAVPEMIVVAVPNMDRTYDFTPIIDPDSNRRSGGGDNFLKFMEEELIPAIDKQYRTQKYRILFGHSLTAMFSVYALTSSPQLFDGYISASPYLQFADNFVVQKTEEKFRDFKEFKKSIYISLGDEPRYVESLDRLTKLFKEENPKYFEWKFEKMDSENHATIPHKTIYNGLSFIFKDWQISFDKATSLSAIKEHYNYLTERFGFAVKPSENLMNRLGYNVIGKENYDEAIKIFKANVELHPESDNVYDSLGEAFERKGALKEAVKNYTLAVKNGTKNKSRNLQIYKTNLDRASKALNQ